MAAEYVPIHGPSTFQTGRAAFLRDMLGRSRLLGTRNFHRRLDATARVNLQAELRRLAD